VPRLAVNGASGFVGRHLVAAGRAAGWDVVGVARSSRSGDLVSAAGGRPVVVPDLHDVSALARAFAGADAVAHLAHIGAERGGDTYEAVNVEGTRRAAKAAGEAGVRRIACFSGLGVAHYGMAPRTTSRYFLSKIEAEVALFHSGLDVAVFRPSYIVGPGDGLTKMLREDLARGVVERPGDGRYRMQPVAVADAAAAILAVSSLPVEGEKHRVFDLVGPEPIAFDDFVARFAARAGGTYTVRSVPVEEADRQARAGGYRGMLPDELDCMLCDEVADPAPLAALLGRPLTPLDAAIDAAVAGAP
jgi:NADH dehydrogenase